MTQSNSKAPLSLPKPPHTEIADIGSIRAGGGFRLPKTEIEDTGRIRIGGGFRLPTA